MGGEGVIGWREGESVLGWRERRGGVGLSIEDGKRNTTGFLYCRKARHTTYPLLIHSLVKMRKAK